MTDSEKVHEFFQPVTDKMIKAGWLSASFVNPAVAGFGWTPLGEQRIKQLGDIFDELGIPCFTNNNEFAALLAILKLNAAQSGFGGQV